MSWKHVLFGLLLLGGFYLTYTIGNKSYDYETDEATIQCIKKNWGVVDCGETDRGSVYHLTFHPITQWMRSWIETKFVQGSASLAGFHTSFLHEMFWSCFQINQLENTTHKIRWKNMVNVGLIIGFILALIFWAYVFKAIDFKWIKPKA